MEREAVPKWVALPLHEGPSALSAGKRAPTENGVR